MREVFIIVLGCIVGGLLVAATMLFFGQMQTNTWVDEMRKVQEKQQASFEGRGDG